MKRPKGQNQTITFEFGLIGLILAFWSFRGKTVEMRRRWWWWWWRRRRRRRPKSGLKGLKGQTWRENNRNEEEVVVVVEEEEEEGKQLKCDVGGGCGGGGGKTIEMWQWWWGGKTIEMWQWWWWRENNRNEEVEVEEGNKNIEEGK